jgi:hypothetical protein
MTLFSYTARDSSGKRTAGQIDEMSLQAARDALKKKGIDAEEIHEATLDERGIRKEFRVEEPRSPRKPKDPAPKEQLPPKRSPSPTKDQRSYYPLTDTLRLYAGWLLAWYLLVMAIGSFMEAGSLPLNLPLITSLASSPLILKLACGTFLFLLFSSLHRRMKGTVLSGLVFSLIGITLFVLYSLNV